MKKTNRQSPFWCWVSILFLAACASNPVYQASWKASSWQTAQVYDSENDLTIACANDSSHLYLRIETENEETIQKLFSLGLVVWLDPSAHFKKSYGVQYPLPGERSVSANTLSEMSEQKVKDVRFQKIGLEGFGTKIPIVLPVSELESGFNAAIAITPTGLFSYQLKLPFEEIGIYPNAKKTLSLVVESYLRAEERYETSLSDNEYLEKRLDDYKAVQLYDHNHLELQSLRVKFLLK